jgi:hypothetical protein
VVDMDLVEIMVIAQGVDSVDILQEVMEEVHMDQILEVIHPVVTVEALDSVDIHQVVMDPLD